CQRSGFLALRDDLLQRHLARLHGVSHGGKPGVELVVRIGVHAYLKERHNVGLALLSVDGQSERQAARVDIRQGANTDASNLLPGVAHGRLEVQVRVLADPLLRVATPCASEDTQHALARLPWAVVGAFKEHANRLIARANNHVADAYYRLAAHDIDRVKLVGFSLKGE